MVPAISHLRERVYVHLSLRKATHSGSLGRLGAPVNAQVVECPLKSRLGCRDRRWQAESAVRRCEPEAPTPRQPIVSRHAADAR